MSRPLLVGLHNPLSPEPEFALYPLPEFALYPLPEFCTGGRIAALLRPAFGVREYLRAFDRVNLLRHDERVGGKGYAARLRRAREQLIIHIGAGKYETVVLFGADVWRSVLGVPGRRRPPWLTWETVPMCFPSGVGWRVRFLTLSHLSGRNLWYNEPANRAAAGRALRQLAVTGLAEVSGR